MPFRRSFSRFSRRTGGYRRSRFASAVRPPTRAGQGRWQWGNLFFQQTFTTVAPGTVNIFAELVSLEPSHFFDPNADATTSAITISNMAKAIDVGGLTFDCGIHHSTLNIDAEDGSLAQRFICQSMLVLDRKGPTGEPSGVEAPFHLSTFPTNTVDATVPRPSSLNEVRDYPSRILWRRAHFVNPSLVEYNNPDSENISALRQNEVYNPVRYRNLRVKKRIADDYGLFYVASIAPVPSISENLIFTCWLSGSLYYRVRF